MSSIYDNMTELEKEVANYLKSLGLRWTYQSPLFLYDNEGRPRVWTPDFYIPKLGIYIEVWGSRYRKYDFRKEIYELNQIPVIFIHAYKQELQWKNYLQKRIREIHTERASEIDKMSKSD
jgi:hypothetical protein